MAFISLETVQRATLKPSRLQLTPDLADAVDLEVLAEDPKDLRLQRFITLDARRRLVRASADAKRVRGRWMGRSSEPGRSARPRTRRDDRR